LAASRLRIVISKRSATTLTTIVLLTKELSKNEELKARVLAISLLQDHNTIDVFEILSTICELLQERMGVMSRKKRCPTDLESAVATLIYCSTRLDIPELCAIRKQFRRKYGGPFIDCALRNSKGIVDERVVSKMSHQVSSFIVQEYVREFREYMFPKATTTQSARTKGPITPNDDHDVKGNTIPLKPPEEAATSNKEPTNEGRDENGVYVGGTSMREPAPNEDTKNDEESNNDECESMTTMLGYMSLSSQAGNEEGKRSRHEGGSSSLLSPTLPVRIFRPNPDLEIAFDVRTRNPLYVMEKLHDVAKDRTKIRPPFYEEEGLPEVYRTKLRDFLRSGYDRGHMAPAADFGDETVKDTFTLCNVSPQVHSLNISTWVKVEQWCRRVAQREREEMGGVTHVVTGPLWLPAKRTSEEHFRYNYPAIGPPSSLIHVPTHFFKVIVVVVDDAIRKFACFVVPNANVDKDDKKSLRNYLVHWSELEIVSGLQFFPQLTARDGWRDSVRAITEVWMPKSSNILPGAASTKKKHKSLPHEEPLEHLLCKIDSR
jgi:endonuclease G